MTNKEKFIAVVSNLSINKSDAIIILEGDKDNRISHACELYNSKYSDNIVFSGNILNLKYGSFPLEYVKDTFKQCGFPLEKIIHEDQSTNTKEQAQEVIKLCLENNWKSIILIASHYHQYRAYLTFISELYNKKLNNTIKIYNSPCVLPWFRENNWGMRYKLLESEFKKIKFYQSKKDICTFTKAINYIKWLEQF